MSDITAADISNVLGAFKTATGAFGKFTDSIRKSKAKENLQDDVMYRARKEKMKQFDNSLKNSAESLIDFADTADGAIHQVKNLLEKMIGGALVGLLISNINSSINTYRQLNDLGQSFDGSIAMMTRAAGQAGLPIGDFAEAVKHNSKVIAAMSQKDFFRLALNLRETSYKFGMFGLTTEQATEYFGDYLETIRHFGNAQVLNDTRNVRNFIKLNETSSGLAAAFGTSKTQILKSTNELLQSSVVAAKLSTMAGDVQADTFDKLTQATAFFASQPGEAGTTLGKMVTDAFAYGSSILTEEGKMFIDGAMGQTVGLMDTIVEKIRNGTFQDADAFSFIDQFKDEVDKNMNALIIQAQAGNENARKVLTINQQLRRMSMAEYEAAKAASNKRTTITNFFENLGSIYNKVSGAFIDGLMKPLTDMATAMAAILPDGKFEKILLDISKMGESFGVFVAEIFTPENVNNFATGFSTILNSLMDGVNDLKANNPFGSLGGIIHDIVYWGAKFAIVVGEIVKFGGMLGSGLMDVFSTVNQAYTKIFSLFGQPEWAAGATALTAFLGFFVGKNLISSFFGNMMKTATVNAGVVYVNGKSIGGGIGGVGGNSKATGKFGKVVGAAGAVAGAVGLGSFLEDVGKGDVLGSALDGIQALGLFGGPWGIGASVLATGVKAARDTWMPFTPKDESTINSPVAAPGSISPTSQTSTGSNNMGFAAIVDAIMAQTEAIFTFQSSSIKEQKEQTSTLKAIKDTTGTGW